MNGIKEKFESFYPGRTPERLYSAPGRTEICGNHTDHQHGKVLAAAVELLSRAAVLPNNSGVIRVKSEGYDYFEIDLSELSPVTAERGTTAALVRGVAAGLPGSGLSSSASFEVLIGTVINDLGEFGLTPVEIARIGQYAENVFFGKPSGLMDQTACAVGGTIAIDFSAPEDPVIRPVCADFGGFGHSLCIIESGADHAGLGISGKNIFGRCRRRNFTSAFRAQENLPGIEPS